LIYHQYRIKHYNLILDKHQFNKALLLVIVNWKIKATLLLLHHSFSNYRLYNKSKKMMDWNQEIYHSNLRSQLIIRIQRSHLLKLKWERQQWVFWKMKALKASRYSSTISKKTKNQMKNWLKMNRMIKNWKGKKNKMMELS
jgi:hypothetical protein